MVDRLLRQGYWIFALAMIGLGVETMICARDRSSDAIGHGYDVIPVLPFLPPIPWLAYAFGAVWTAWGLGLLHGPSARTASAALGTVLLLGAIVLDAPRAATHFGSMPLRTVLFESLALASLAWILPGRSAVPARFAIARYVLVASLLVFGVDHFLDLNGIATLVPQWIPWHAFWVAFFGAAFVAAGIAIASGRLRRPAAALLGLMYALWVLTLHLPRTLGLYGAAGAVYDPAEWSSLFVAVALWGGLWALADDCALHRGIGARHERGRSRAGIEGNARRWLQRRMRGSEWGERRSLR